MAKVQARLKKLSATLKSLEGPAKKADKDLIDLIKKGSAIKDRTVIFKGLVKAYMDAVKKTDGATSVRPATLKAIQTAEKSPSKQTVAAAEKALQAHVADVKGTKDAKVKKFAADTSAIAAKLKAML